MFMRILPGILAVPLLIVGVLYGTEVGKANKANDKVTSLTANLAVSGDKVTSLTTDLAAANSKTAGLTTDLAAANTNVTRLTAELAAANNRVTGLTTDLATANNRVTTITADLAAASTNVTRLTAELTAANSRSSNFTAELAAANSKVTSLTADLALAMNNASRLTAELEAAKDDADTFAAALLIIGYPRHFYTLQELTDWLAKDDTNTNPAYTGLRPSERAYILMVKSLQNGFILSARVTSNSSGVFSSNVAIVGGAIYQVIASTDQIFLEGNTTPYTPRPVQPLP